MTEPAATGFAAGSAATTDLVVEAVRSALEAAGSDFAHSILLLLTSHYARHAQPAVTAAGRTARCLQVAGCTVSGVFTERRWALDQPAAAALVLTGNISLGQASQTLPQLTFCRHEQAQPSWISPGPTRMGTLASGEQDGAAGAIWGHGKLLTQGRFEGSFSGARVRTELSRGMRMISAPLALGDHDRHEIFQLNGRPALQTLTQGLPLAGPLPLTHLFAAVLDPDCPSADAATQGRYTLLPILGVNPDERSVTLAAVLPSDARLCWALRDTDVAVGEVRNAVSQMAMETQRSPAFGLMFSCIGRGPFFYDGEDCDLAAVIQQFPGLPLIGAYGAGEIGPQAEGNTLYSYSSVLSLVTPDVQSH